MAVSKEWAFLRSAMRKVYNFKVNKYFRDIDGEILENINMPRVALKRACLIRSTDSIGVAQAKRDFFLNDVLSPWSNLDICGTPKEELDRLFKYKPEIHLFFRQDHDAVPDGFRAIEGSISFRLINESSTTITETELRRLATEINKEFGVGDGYLWDKGKEKYTYLDPEHGLDLRLLCLNESTALELVRKFCGLVNTSYDSNLFTPHIPKKNSINNPPKQTILGESRNKPRYRPTARVRFRCAKAMIHGLPSAVYLVDKTGYHPSAYIYL